MTEELATVIYFQVYTPFALAICLVLAYTYKADEKTNGTVDNLDEKLDIHIKEFAIIKESQSNQIELLSAQTAILQQINTTLVENTIVTTRTDEKVKAVADRVERMENSYERRSEIRSINS
tara:strand:+ start:37133 stop:37495 length:363 start_codon:yes stop_codon:yes gene_type:complete